jgi:2-keto-4-pentenoate hydratase/2-oxohepta-3-ene-1,7-dioic acid hydratase in catechol pathway
MSYHHKNFKNEKINLPLGKVICIGRNYALHAKELGNEIPESPLFFMKPKTALCDIEKPFSIPNNQGEVHFETEIAVLLAANLKQANAQQVEQAIWGFGIAFDLTLREVQNALKKSGQPWEKAKAFDGACPVSRFIDKEKFQSQQFLLESKINGARVQLADTRLMLWSITELIIEMSKHFTLEAGDIILTGTPEGVGPLRSGDKLSFSLSEIGQAESSLEFSSSVL